MEVGGRRFKRKGRGPKAPDGVPGAPGDPVVSHRVLEGVARTGGLKDGRGANVFDTVFSG